MNGAMTSGAGRGRTWDEGSFTLRDVLTVVFKRRRLILGFFVVAVGLGLAAALLLPPVYEATAAILVKKSSAEVPLIPTESSQLIISQVTESDLNSEIMILKSRPAIEEVLQDLGGGSSTRREGALQRTKAQIKEFLGIPRLAALDALVLELEEDVEVAPVRRSNVLQVRYRHGDPDWATRVVQGLTERYISRRTELYQSPKAVPFFEEEMRTAEARLRKAEQDLEAYSRQAGVSVLAGEGDTQSLGAEKAATLARLTEFEQQLGEAAVDLRQQTQRVATLESQLAQEPERLPSAQRGNQDPTTEELERALVTLQLKRDALTRDFTPENRQVKDIDDQIRAVQERLREAEARFNNINRTEINQIHQALRGQLLLARADLRGAQARYDSLQTQVVDQRRQLDELNRKSLTTDELTREVRAAEDAYVLYKKKHEEARISAAMEQERIINVSIAQPAQRPLKPVAPNRRTNLLFGMFFGLFGGLALAFVIEFLDHSFTTGRELEARLGIPLLGSIPDESSVGAAG